MILNNDELKWGTCPLKSVIGSHIEANNKIVRLQAKIGWLEHDVQMATEIIHDAVARQLVAEDARDRLAVVADALAGELDYIYNYWQAEEIRIAKAQGKLDAAMLADNMRADHLEAELQHERDTRAQSERRAAAEIARLRQSLYLAQGGWDRADRLVAALREVDLYFQSGNSVPVERATIPASEWTRIKTAAHEALGACPDPDGHGCHFNHNGECLADKEDRMNFWEAAERCHVRSAIYRKSNPNRLYWKNLATPLDARVPSGDKLATDWAEYDPRDSDEGSLFSFND